MFLSFKAPKKIKLIEFANSVDSVEAAHIEPPHLNLHYILPNL